MNLRASLWFRVTVLLILALILLPASITWDNVAWRLGYGFFYVTILISPLSGRLWGIYATPLPTDFDLLAYVFKVLVAIYVLPFFLRGRSLRPKVGVFALILLGASLLAQHFNTLYYSLLFLWYPRPPSTLPSAEFVDGFFGWLKPGQGAIRLATFLTTGLVASLVLAQKYQPAPPSPEARVPLRREEGDRYLVMDGVALLGLGGTLFLLWWGWWIPTFFLFGTLVLYGFLGYFGLYLILRVSWVLGDDKAPLLLKPLYGPVGRSKAAWLILSGSMLASASFILLQSWNTVWLIHAGFLLGVGVPLLAATLRNKIPVF